MNMIVRMALKRKINRIAASEAQAVSVHQWVCGLDMDSGPELLRAAERDVIENGLAFVMQGGAETYQVWLRKQWPRRHALALTKATGNDTWWWEAQDRAQGLVLLEHGEIESMRFGAADVPVPALIGLDYSDLFRGHLRAAGFAEVEPRRCEERASGGRGAVA